MFYEAYMILKFYIRFFKKQRIFGWKENFGLLCRMPPRLGLTLQNKIREFLITQYLLKVMLHSQNQEFSGSQKNLPQLYS
jgi:hypothetical protein